MTPPLTTGLGHKVDALVNRSPTLTAMLQTSRQRWPAEFRINTGPVTARSHRTITINPQESALDKTLALAHELGHMLNNQVLIPGGATFGQFIQHNVQAQIGEEASAVRADLKVRSELRHSGQSVPRLVAEVLVQGKTQGLDLEAIQNDPQRFNQAIARSLTEVSQGQGLEDYLRAYYSTPAMQGIYKGFQPIAPAPKPTLKPKRPSSFNLNPGNLIQEFLPARVAPGIAPAYAAMQAFRQQMQTFTQNAQAAQAQRMRTQPGWPGGYPAEVGPSQPATLETQWHFETLADEAARRTRAEEEHRRLAEARRAEELADYQRRQSAIRAATIKRPTTPDILRPNYWGPGPKPGRGITIAVIGEGPQIMGGHEYVRWTPVQPNIFTVKRRW